MARMKLTPKKEREGKTMLRKKEECKRIVKKGRRPPLLYTTLPARKPSPMREVEKTVAEAERWVEEARWLEEVGRSLSLLPT